MKDKISFTKPKQNDYEDIQLLIMLTLTSIGEPE